MAARSSDLPGVITALMIKKMVEDILPRLYKPAQMTPIRFQSVQ
jgi:hypothetical protein